jgi:hypothetical protein
MFLSAHLVQLLYAQAGLLLLEGEQKCVVGTIRGVQAQSTYVVVSVYLTQPRSVGCAAEALGCDSRGQSAVQHTGCAAAGARFPAGSVAIAPHVALAP